MTERTTRIQWLKPEEGGRSSLPAGPTYSTVARFDVLADRWPREAWSVVLNISAPADPRGVMTAGIRMLAGDEAPAELLSPGSKFELYEGHRCVARGEVL